MDQDYIKKTTLKNEAYADRSGCAVIAAAMGIIALFWVVVGAVYLFT